MSTSAEAQAAKAGTHTPAPWTVNPYAGVEVFFGGTERTQDGCDVYHVREEQAQANARLISAAPELLHALKAAMRKLEGLATSTRTSPFFAGVLVVCRTAIAKAEGREP